MIRGYGFIYYERIEFDEGGISAIKSRGREGKRERERERGKEP